MDFDQRYEYVLKHADGVSVTETLLADNATILVDAMGFFIGLAGEVSRRNIGTFDHSPIIGDDLDKLHSAALDAINQLRRLHASDGTKPVEVVFAYAAPAVCDVEHLKFLLEMRFDVAQELVKDDGQDAFMLEWEAALEGAVRPAMHPTTKLTTPTGVPPFLFIEQLQHSLQESGVRIIEVEGRLSSCAGLLVEQLNARYVLSNDTDLLLTPGVNVVLLHPILPDESSATPPATDPHSVWNVLLPRKTLFGKNVAAPTREVRVFFSNKLLGVLGVTFDELHRVASLCRNSISDRLSIEDAVAQVKRGQADGEGAHRPDPETRVQLFYETNGRGIPAEKLALLRSGRFESPLVPTPESDTRCFLYTISTFRRLKHVEAYLLGRSDVTFVFDEDDTQEVDAGLSGLPRWDATLPAITDKAVAAKTISRVFNVNEDVATKLFDKENSNKLPPAVLLVLWAMCDACDDMEEIWRITEMLVLVYLASNPNAGASAAAKEIAEQTKPTSNSSQGLLASAKLAHLFATAYTEVADVLQLLKLDTVLPLPQPANLFSASVLLGVHQSTFTERSAVVALRDVIDATIESHVDEFIDLISEEMLDIIVAKREANDTHGREIPAEKLALLRSGRFESPLVPTPESDTRCFLYTISTFRRLKHVEAYLLGRSDVTFVFDEDDTQEVDAGLSGLPRWDATLPAITDKAVAAKTISRVFNVNEDVATKLFDKENSNKLPPAVLLVLWAMCDACDDMEEIWRITEMLVLVYLASNPNAGASAAAKEIAEQTKPTSNSSQGLLASAKLAHLFATAYTEVADVLQLLKLDTVLKLPQPADLFSASVLLGVHQSTFTERNGIALNDVIYNTIKWHIDEFIDLIPEEMLNFIVAKGEAGAEVAAPPPSAKQKQSSKQVSRSKAKHDDGTWTVVNSQAKRSERIRQSAPSAMMGVAQRVAAAYRLGCKMIVTHSFRGGTRILAEKIGQALNNPAKVGYLLGDPRGKSGQREKRTSESTAICVTPTGFFTTVLQYFPCLPRYMKHRASITNVIIVAPSAAEWTPQHERRTGEIFDAAGVERW